MSDQEKQTLEDDMVSTENKKAVVEHVSVRVRQSLVASYQGRYCHHKKQYSTQEPQKLRCVS